jgi:transposase
LKDIPLENLVVIDESGALTNMTRTRGRCLRSDRLVSAVPHGHWKVLTIIAAMTLEGIQTAVTVDAPCDGEIFRNFVRDVLIPTLRPGQVVIMDNLQSHKVSGIRQAIESAGARLLYLPPYSPDLSPIEPMWSKIKQKLRSLAARTIETLGEAVQQALMTITSSDCQGFFKHTGYAIQDK